MSVFTTYLFYLRHEWRQNRAALAFCALFSAGLALWATTFFDAYTVSQPSVAIFGLLQAALLYLFAVGSGLLASNERNAPNFFDRLPRALGAPFAAKASLYFMGLISAIAFGYLALWASSVWRLGVAPLSPLDLEGFGLGAGLLLAVAAWSFVASGWVPRAALALPISVLQIVVLSIPYGIVRWLVGPRFQIELVPTLVFLGSISLAALPAAFVSFRLARGGMRRPLRGAITALAIGSLFAAPSWGFLASSRRAPQRLTCEDSFQIYTVTFSEDEEHILARIDPARGWHSGIDNLVYSLDARSGAFERPIKAEFRSSSRLMANFNQLLQGDWGSRGLSYWTKVQGSPQRHFFDPQRGIERTYTEVTGKSVKHGSTSSVWVGENWLYWSDEDDSLWSYDPELDTRRRLPWSKDVESSHGPDGLMLSDGRFLYTWGRELFVGDPRTGESRALLGQLGLDSTYLKSQYAILGARLLDSRPPLIRFGLGQAYFVGEKILLGPCLEGHPHARIVDYRVTSSARQFLWVDGHPPGVGERPRKSEIWLSDADSGQATRVFPPHDPDEDTTP